MSVSVRSRLGWVASLGAVGLLVATCGGDKPSDSTPPVTQPPAPVAVATPTPAPTALPGMSCNLPAVSAPANRCERESTGQFIPAVDGAIAKLQREQPSIFDGNLIKDLPAYRVGVLKNLEAQGLCVEWDADRQGHREIMVKNTNSYSEQYNISLSNGNLRNGDGAYRSTCYPANFPVNPQPLGQRGDCKLPSSRDFGCDRLTNPQFVGLMDSVVAEVIKERPDLVRDDYIVGSWDAYHNAIIQKLLARGYCAVFNVTEISVKNTNDFSEQYQMEYSWAQLRKGTQSYKVTCRPATF
jgi:hypothetical protein